MATDTKRILVTDDEPGIVDLITGMLSRFGFISLRAYSGEECLRITKAEQPDLIFLDIMMERMDGWEVARVIKNDPAIRVISFLCPVPVYLLYTLAESVLSLDNDRINHFSFTNG